MLKISNYSFSPNNGYNQSFKANMNTRQILDRIDNEDYIANGRPRIQKIAIEKNAKRMAYRRVVPNKTLYSGCSSKVRYPNENAANYAKKIVEVKKGIKMAIYECPLCNGWHVCKAINKYTKKIPF